jgi:uncharacterized hydrophobic protein (TIGR00271 family)
MLHLRVVCASADTEAVLELLGSEPGVAHLVVARGVSRQPPAGDLVEAEVAREAAERVLDGVRTLGVEQRGAVSLAQVDALLSDTATAAESAVPGEAADALIWDELIATTGEQSQLSGIFLAFLTLACLLAAVGVLTDSAITIVGAMVVGPEFGPLAALAVALVARRRALAARAGFALSVGFPAAMLITAGLALAARAAGLFHPARLGQLPVAGFIYHVGPYSAIVALLAGAAGMLALTSEKSGVLVGVFISVTTVPAAGFAALAAVAGHWQQCGGALLQLLINLAGITLAGALTLLLRRGHVHPRAGHVRSRRIRYSRSPP